MLGLRLQSCKCPVKVPWKSRTSPSGCDRSDAVEGLILGVVLLLTKPETTKSWNWWLSDCHARSFPGKTVTRLEHVWTCLKVSCFCNVQKELGQTLVVGTSWIVEINIASNHNEQHEHLTARIRQNPTESDGVRFRFVKASSGAGEPTQHRDLHSAIELKRLKRPARNNSE